MGKPQALLERVWIVETTLPLAGTEDGRYRSAAHGAGWTVTVPVNPPPEGFGDGSPSGPIGESDPAALTRTGPPPSEPERVEDFDGFYRREFPSMVALCTTIVGPAMAEDLAQEAMVRAHRNWTKISAYDRPGAWVRRVAINLATSSVRRKGVELRGRLRMGRAETAEPAHEVQAGNPLWSAVADLAPRQRAAIALHYLEDRPVAEIAELLGCAESTAKVHLHKGRQNLARALGHEWDER